jgi:hypothetical protein
MNPPEDLYFPLQQSDITLGDPIDSAAFFTELYSFIKFISMSY